MQKGKGKLNYARTFKQCVSPPSVFSALPKKTALPTPFKHNLCHPLFSCKHNINSAGSHRA